MAQKRKRSAARAIEKEVNKQKSLLLAELKEVGSVSEAVALLRRKREELLTEKARIRKELTLLEGGDRSRKKRRSSLPDNHEDYNNDSEDDLINDSNNSGVDYFFGDDTNEDYALDSLTSSSEDSENRQNLANGDEYSSGEEGLSGSGSGGEGELKGKWVQCSHALLKREARPLSVTDIIQIALDEGMIYTKSKTPKNTLTSILNTEVKRKGSVFRKVAPSIFALKEFEASNSWTVALSVEEP